MNGHEREDGGVPGEIYVPGWKSLENRFAIFNGGGSWKLPPGM